MNTSTAALGLLALAFVGSLAGWAAPRLAPRYPRAAAAARLVAALAVNLHGALTAGRPPALTMGETAKPPEAP